MKKIVSIIVPIYNVEQYLNECIQSLICQTYKEIDIVLINDGSTDNSSTIIKEWEEKDKRIQSILQKNGGLSSARNTGIKYAKGSYIMFVDSDDIISFDMVETLVSNLETTNADISACDCIEFTNQFSENKKTLNSLSTYSTFEAMSLILKDCILKQMVCNKLYKEEIIKNIFFPVGKCHEDVFWTYKVIARAKIVCYTPKTLYGYRQRVGSIMNSKYDERRLDALEAMESRSVFISYYFPTLELLAQNSYAGACLYHYQLICKLHPENSKKLKSLVFNRYKNIDKFYFKKIKKQFIWLSLFRIFPDLTCFIRNKLKIGI